MREAESTSENNKAMELFYRAVEAMNYDELVGATADVEKKTGILGGSSSTLDHTVKSEVLPNNAAASMDENGRMKNDNHRRKMYSKCLSDAEKKYDKCSSEPIPRNCGWIRHRDKRTCKNKWVPSNHQKLAEARAVNNGSGARARTSHAKADGHRADSYSKSDSLYAAVRNKIDLTNAGAMRALKLAKQARNEAMAQLVGSKNDDFKTTKASVERIITKKEVDRIFELSTDLNEATVRNVDILSVSAGCTTDFDCSKLGDTFSISYYLFIAASAIYLAEQIRIKNDYSVNIREIMESNPDDDQKYDEQTVQMMKAANIRNETNDFAVRLTKTKANVKEMYIWVDKIAQWEYRSMAARMAAADAQVASADAAKESTEAKKKHGIDWRALALVIVIICIAIMVACCAPTPPACCAPAAIAYRVAVGILIA
ncbi:MAG: hypothetical protein KAQ98_10550, partial [Bacteriovoracaceae bacterium]|nr:hypothetical protein [Bacteriovoracaceae bacterium]